MVGNQLASLISGDCQSKKTGLNRSLNRQFLLSRAKFAAFSISSGTVNGSCRARGGEFQCEEVG